VYGTAASATVADAAARPTDEETRHMGLRLSDASQSTSSANELRQQ